MKLWLDDIREPPDGWLWAKNAGQAIAIIQAFADSPLEWEDASFDNDLGEGLPEGHTVVYYMAEHNIWPTQKPTAHSSNPPRRDHIRGMIDRYGPYE